MENYLFMKSFFIFCICLKFSGATFYLPDYGAEELTSDTYNYTNHSEEIDVIWRYWNSIEIEVDTLQLDGQCGDFLLISDQPLAFDEYFEEYNNSAEVPSFLTSSIVTSQGLLLSWELASGSKFHILSKYGAFIYFHSEGPEAVRGMFNYTGFNITVRNLDELRTPPPTTTTEGTVAPPEPQTKIYTSKFLSCNPPEKFLEEKEQFKSALAQIATDYCRENEACSIELSSDLLPSDINIPSEDGLHMCDRAWPIFSSCVEVTFAITREEEDGNYLMPKWRLDEMWSLKAKALEDAGYCPFDPPATLATIDTWVWMASVLGLLIFIMMPMCLLWIWNEQDYKRPGEKEAKSGVEAEEKAELETTTWIDRGNPLRAIVQKLKKQNEDAKYLEVSNSERHYADREDPSSRTVKNVLFQEQEVGFEPEDGLEYDNRGYRHDDEEDDVILYGGHEQSRGEQGFLTIDRQQDGNSDTEI